MSRVWRWGRNAIIAESNSGTEAVGMAGCLGLWFRVVGFIGGGSGLCFWYYGGGRFLTGAGILLSGPD